MRTCRGILVLSSVLAIGACSAAHGGTDSARKQLSAPTSTLAPNTTHKQTTTSHGRKPPTVHNPDTGYKLPTPVTVHLTTTPDADVHVRLRVGQSLTVVVDPKLLDWVGGNDTFAPALTTTNPCDTTCNGATRTFTATIAGTARIETVQHCGVGAMCALGQAVVVTAAPE
jgi:hypothetical protein